MQGLILAGDVGGTNTRLALFEPGPRPRNPLALAIIPSGRHRSLDRIVRGFMETHRRPIASACFGVAGPVRQGRCEATNLPWTVDAGRLARTLGIARAELINDLEANAYGIALLGPRDFCTLNAGRPDAGGNAALIAAGTGLGEAGLHWEGALYRPVASEGGHADFAPTGELQTELLLRLRRRFGHVSTERVLSGPGLRNIYAFLRDTGRGRESPAFARRLARSDLSAAISEEALNGGCALCARTLDLFVSIYGAEAGNLALQFKATAGLYVGGGIAPKILRKLREPGFMRAFQAKGRLRPLLRRIPVRVILNDKAALLGAAYCAARRIQLDAPRSDSARPRRRGVPAGLG